MQCEEVEERLSAFLDDELDPVMSREIQGHVDGCAACSEVLGQMKGLADRLRAEAPYYRASNSLQSRVSQAAWRDATRGRGVGRRVGAPAGAWLRAAAAVVVLLGGMWFFASLQGQERFDSMEREAVSGHIRSLMASHLTDVASTDQHTVKPWFAGKLDFSPPVVDLATSGYPLIGGRLDYLGGRPVAALVYQRHNHWINVFIWPGENTANSATPPRTEQGYHVVHETHAGMTYWIVSDVNSVELSTFARLLVAGA
jgi:anti-sigma factor RsiW